MKLVNMKIEGFMKYKESFEVNFDNETYIIGGNAKGKSTIAYAIVWAFLGTNLRGNDKISLINRDSKECTVELNFIDNDNQSHSLIRYKNNKYSAKNSLLLDGNNIKQEKLEKFYIEKQLFLSIFNPDYFKECTPAKQKELIDNYLPRVSILDVYNKLQKSDKEKLVIADKEKTLSEQKEKMKIDLDGKITLNEQASIKEIIKYFNEKVKDIESKIISKKGSLEYAQKIVSEKLEKKKIFEKQEEIDLLEQEKDYLETEGKQQMKEKLQKEIGENEASELNLKIKLDKIKEKERRTKIEYNQMLSNPLAFCVCCKQPLNNSSKNIALENKRKELFSLSDECQEIENKITSQKIIVIKLKSRLYALGNKDNSKRIIEITNRLKELYKEKGKLIYLIRN